MQTRTLSSAYSFYAKFVVPAFMFSMVVALGFSMVSRLNHGVVPLSEWTLPVAMGVVAAWAGWWYAQLKRVRADELAIYVSNYRTAVRVPFDEILSVTGINFPVQSVRIRFRHPTPFGKSVVFMPCVWMWPWGPHPVVGELRKLAGL